jgi:hypothetical protein
MPNQAMIDTNLVEPITMEYPTGTRTATREAVTSSGRA